MFRPLETTFRLIAATGVCLSPRSRDATDSAASKVPPLSLRVVSWICRTSSAVFGFHCNQMCALLNLSSSICNPIQTIFIPAASASSAWWVRQITVTKYTAHDEQNGNRSDVVAGRFATAVPPAPTIGEDPTWKHRWLEFRVKMDTFLLSLYEDDCDNHSWSSSDEECEDDEEDEPTMSDPSANIFPSIRMLVAPGLLVTIPFKPLVPKSCLLPPADGTNKKGALAEEKDDQARQKIKSKLPVTDDGFELIN